MMKRGTKKQLHEVSRAKAAISRNLRILEEKLKSFRSTSPEKWIEEVGKDYTFDEYDLLSTRSTSEESSSSANSEDTAKTIAENENFIKQKIGGIEDELKIFSAKVMNEGMYGLQEDIRNMQEGLNGLKEVVRKWDSKSTSLPVEIHQGLLALQNGLNQITEDVRTFVNNKSLNQTSQDFQLTIEECLKEIKLIDKSLREVNYNQNQLKEALENFDKKFNSIKNVFDKLKEESSTLTEVHKGLEDVKQDIKTKIKELINVPNKSDDSDWGTSELFENLEENDFINFNSTVSYEIADYILRREESEIALMRDGFAKNLASSQCSSEKTNIKK